MADRLGRLKDEPGKIEAEIFPFKFQTVKIVDLMDGLAFGEDPFITRYEVDGRRFIQIVNFSVHQNPHPREVPSDIPPCKKKAIPRHCLGNAQDLPSNALSPLSVTSLSPFPILIKTSSPQAGSPHWQAMVDHINNTWTAKKRGAKFLWQQKDFKALKGVVSVYRTWDAMALWDVYIRSDDEFARKQGYNVMEFVRQMPRLVDDPMWRSAAKAYLDKLEPANPEGLVKVGDLVSDALAGKEIPKK